MHFRTKIGINFKISFIFNTYFVSIRALFFIVIPFFIFLNVGAQQLKPFRALKKWGFTNGTYTIKAQYDTAFMFDKANRIACVGNRSEFSKNVNPLTGEEEATFDYFYIDKLNNKLKVKDDNFPDSISTLPDQQELNLNYIGNSNFFKILFQNKVYLFSKNGKQLSSGFDDIYENKHALFYITENYVEIDQRSERIKGLIDTSGKTIVKNKYHQITVNKEDSIIYCCSAVFSTKLSDDVFNFKGQLIYSNKKHIEFSSKTIHVLKTYEPTESFIIENDLTKKSYTIEGEQFIYLKNNKALIIRSNNWVLLDLLTAKEKKINKDKFIQKFQSLLEY